MAKKEFIFEKVVYLTDTNLYGNTYFARYFDWQGMAREEFFKQIVGDYSSFLKTGIKLVTIEAYLKYWRETTLFDNVIIKVTLENIQVATFELHFTYINKKTEQLVAEGKQKIGFVDSSNKVIPIPQFLKDSWLKFCEK